MYDGWGNSNDEFFHPFQWSDMGIHFVPNKLSETVIKSGYFNVIEKTIKDHSRGASQSSQLTNQTPSPFGSDWSQISSFCSTSPAPIFRNPIPDLPYSGPRPLATGFQASPCYRIYQVGSSCAGHAGSHSQLSFLIHAERLASSIIKLALATQLASQPASQPASQLAS